LRVGAGEHGSGETSPGAILGHGPHLCRPCLELSGREECELTILSLGNDTTVFETTAKPGGHDHPALLVEAVEVLAEEHFWFSPSISVCSIPFSLGR
jgi:hypothetical protein